MCTCTPWKRLQSERSLPAGLSQRPPELYLGFDPRQGREIPGQAEPYQKWHSYAFRDPRCLKKPWKREHRYMHERADCRSKFPEQTHSFAFPGESADIIRLISKEMECGVRKKTEQTKNFVGLPSRFSATKMENIQLQLRCLIRFNMRETWSGSVRHAEFGQIISVNLFRDDLLWAAYNVNINWHCKLNRGIIIIWYTFAPAKAV